jgi:hypothetical protein
MLDPAVITALLADLPEPAHTEGRTTGFSVAADDDQAE